MRVEDFMEALTSIDPVYVEEAYNWKAIWEKNVWGRLRTWQKVLLPVAACLALVAAGSAYGIFSGRFGVLQDGGMTGHASDAGMSGGAENAMEAESAEGVDTSSAMDAGSAGALPEVQVAVNEVETFMDSIACGPAPSEEEYYTAEELSGYYGIRILPGELPEGLKDTKPAAEYVVSYGEDGNVLSDNCKLVFADETAERELEIAARTVEMDEMRSFSDADLEPSYICGQEVTIGRCGEIFLAIYEKEGVTVTVYSRNLSEEEVIAVLFDLLCE